MKLRTQLTAQGYRVLMAHVFSTLPWTKRLGRRNRAVCIEVMSADSPPRTIATFYPDQHGNLQVATQHANLLIAAVDMLDSLEQLTEKRYEDGHCHKGICSEEMCSRCRRHRAARKAIAAAYGREFTEEVNRCTCHVRVSITSRRDKPCPVHGGSTTR